MTLSPYQRLAYRLFGARIEERPEKIQGLAGTLSEAGIQIRPSAYLATAYLTMVVAFGVSAAGVVALATVRALGLVPVPLGVLLLVTPLPAVVAGLSWVTVLAYPRMQAGSRAGKLDDQIPYALNYMATMAQAGMTPERIFATLASQSIYGQMAEEAGLIERDLNVLGKDIVEALADAAQRSPSRKLRDFYQGAITTLTTGGDLETYLSAKRDQYLQDHRQEQKRFLDDLGVLAEGYVTVVVAAPLLFLIMVTVMISLSGGGDPLGVGYLVVLGGLPLAHAGFTVTIELITPEV